MYSLISWVKSHSTIRESNKRECILLWAQLLALFLAVVFSSVGAIGTNYSIQMIGTFFVWVSSILYCLAAVKDRLILLSFDIVVFVFLMARPLIDIVKNATRWQNYAETSVSFAITSVAVSIFCLQLGAMMCEYIYRNKKTAHQHEKHCYSPAKCDETTFRRTAFCLYLFCMIFFFVREFDALIFMQNKSYIAYYTEYSASYPSYVYTISEMMPYALCLYLATFPKKRPAFFSLALYVVSAIPQLIIGVRNPIVLNIIFAFLYYCIRDFLGDPQKWIGKVEKICIVICAPLAAFALSVHNYVRAGNEIKQTGFFDAIVDLLYKQGVSFDVLCMGHNAIPYLPGAKKCYTFGSIIDRFVRGRMGQLLFGTTPLPSGNGEIRAIEGNSFAHSMSYVAHPGYLEGEGWGSSYLLETYADFGWIGVVVFSFLMGMFFIWFMHKMRGHWHIKTGLLVALTNLLFAPRAEATGWVEFITTVHFWFIVIVCVVGSKILERIDFFASLERVYNKILFRVRKHF